MFIITDDHSRQGLSASKMDQFDALDGIEGPSEVSRGVVQRVETGRNKQRSDEGRDGECRSTRADALRSS